MKKKKQDEEILDDPDEEDEEEEMVSDDEVEEEEEVVDQESQADLEKKFDELFGLYKKLANVVSIQTKWIKRHKHQIAKVEDDFRLYIKG